MLLNVLQLKSHFFIIETLLLETSANFKITVTIFGLLHNSYHIKHYSYLVVGCKAVASSVRMNREMEKYECATFSGKNTRETKLVQLNQNLSPTLSKKLKKANLPTFIHKKYFL